MPTHIILLRGINVGGHRSVPMKDLRALLEGLDLQNVRTYLQSGNAVVDSTKAKPAELRTAIEAAISEHFGFAVAVLVLSVKQLAAIAAANPYSAAAEADPKKVLIAYLFDKVSKQKAAAFAAPAGETAQFHIAPTAVYLHCPDGYGTTKLSNDFFEKKLAVKATTRNWRTVQALLELAASK